VHHGDLAAGGFSDLEMTWLLYCAGTAIASGYCWCSLAIRCEPRRCPCGAGTVMVVVCTERERGRGGETDRQREESYYSGEAKLERRSVADNCALHARLLGSFSDCQPPATD